MWIWVALVLALAALGSMITHIVLAVRGDPRNRSRYIGLAVASLVAMVGIAVAGSFGSRSLLPLPSFGGGGGRQDAGFDTFDISLM